MVNIDFSIVIPSRARPRRLARLVRALTTQFAASSLSGEILVALDGATADPMPGHAEPGHTDERIRTFALPQVGISAAKNVACREARGRIVLFLNDDVLPGPGFLEGHAAAHAADEEVVLGASPWRRQAVQTLLDRALTTTDMVFFYHRMHDGERYDFRHAWNLNLSVKRQRLLQLTGPFDERFRPCMYEDLELAYRLMGTKPRVYFAAQAIAQHDHPYTLGDYLRREALLGLMAPQLAEVNPACFKAIFNSDLATLRMQAKAALANDQRDGQRAAAQLPALATTVWQGDEQAARLFYLAHLPLKRRAFRLGLLAHDKTVKPDWRRRPEVASEALATDPVFAATAETLRDVTAPALAQPVTV